MSDYTSEWGATYNKANIVFSKDFSTGCNGDRAPGQVLRKMLADAVATGPLLSCLSALDKIDLGAGSDKQRAALPANIKAYTAALARFEGEKKKYVKVLDEAQKLKVTVKDKHGYQLPTELKACFPDSYRQLKILQSEIHATSARAANALDSARSTGKQDKIQEDKNKQMAKLTGDDPETNAKAKALSAEAAMKTFLLKFGTSFRSAMAKGAAVIQKIKATPDLATYNREMNDGARDISQNLVNIGKLKADPKFKGTSLAKKLPDPAALGAEITPFANGAKRNLGPTATAADVKQALEEFSRLYKRIAATYADVLSGKIK